MKQSKSVLQSILLALTAAVTGSGYAADSQQAGQTLYPAGSQQSFKGPKAYFTGEVQVDLLFPSNDIAPYSGAYVTFAPGARTAWHMHPAGQHMIVTDGTAVTGTRDGEIIEFKSGETVWCPANIDHWHGATPDAPMTHLVITGSLNGENVIWKEQVSDQDYHGDRSRNDLDRLKIQSLTATQRGIVAIAAFTASGDLEALKVAINAGLDAGMSISEIKEVQIHLYAYAGFPRALNGLAALMTVVEERKARGIEDETGKDADGMPGDKTSLARGKAVQTRLAGRPVTGPLFDFAPAINQLLQSHLFGDLFARGVLDEQGREIATLSALASMSGVESQLRAHIGIASNAGLSRSQLEAVAALLTRHVGPIQGRKVELALDAVLPMREEKP